MNYADLIRLRERLYFTVGDVARILKVKQESARVLCNRYVKSGRFIRLKNNFYVLEERWSSFSSQEFFRLANFLKVPSYISLMTALQFYEVTTQVTRNFFDSVSLKSSKKISIKGAAFNYYKLKKELYFDFIKKDDIFIASKEKAFLDALYLFSFGKYKLDFSALDIEKLDKSRLKKLSGVFPKKTKLILKKICKT
jgi:predicted transcriptional regulator of viral defense system